MRTFEKDYRYLLQNLIPHHRLPIELRRSIEQALESGSAEAMRRQSILALETLCHEAYFLRTQTDSRNGSMIVTYAKRGGIYQLRLIVPREEWVALSSQFEREPSPPEVALEDLEPERVAVGVEATFEILPDVIQSLTISGRSESIAQRLDRLMRSLPEWLDFISANLILIQGIGGDYVGTNEHIEGVTKDKFREVLIHRQAELTGRQMIVGTEAALNMGLSIDSDLARSAAVVPIFAQDEFRGTLQILAEQPVNDETLEDRVRVAGRIVEQVINLNVQIENITSIDALTRIYNRHFYEAQLPIEIERATRTAGKLSMLLIDLDDFKQINDTLGHKKGDEALSTVAGLVKKNLRKIDLAFRYGGEEFVVLLPGTAEIEAVHTAERLRSVISEYRGFAGRDGVAIQLTVSIGVAVFPDNARTEEELFVKADAAMFRAKKRGKNRVELYSE